MVKQKKNKESDGPLNSSLQGLISGVPTILQAVLIADSYNMRFRPLTFEEPRCLLPLLNIPLIDYNLEALSVAGVNEVFIICTAHAVKIKQHLEKCTFRKSMKIIMRNLPSSDSVGDVLRDLDESGLIKNDFILLHGDIISSFDLKSAVEIHKNRKLEDKDAIMTIVTKKLDPFHQCRERCEDAIWVVNDQTSELVSYTMISTEKYKKTSTIELDKILATTSNNADFNIHYDWTDCQVDICSVEVLALFTENFDYQSIRCDFIKGVLQSEILSSKIYTYLLSSTEYCIRIRSPRLYHAVSQDLMQRWAFPLVPDSPWHPISPACESEGGYIFQPPSVYISGTSKISRQSKLNGNILIGEGTQIADLTSISNTVFGKHCRIGANVNIDNCHIWDGVTIEDSCNLSDCIIASDVLIKRNVTIKSGSILSFGVVVGPFATLPESTKVTLYKPPCVETRGGSIQEHPAHALEEPKFSPDHQWDSVEILGQDCEGFIWKEEVDISDELEKKMHLEFDAVHSIGCPKRTIEQEYVTEDICDEFYMSSTMEEEESSFESCSESSSNENFQKSSPNYKAKSIGAHFQSEVAGIIMNAIESCHELSNLALELNGLKFAQNSSFGDIRFSVSYCFLEHMLGFYSDENPSTGTIALNIKKFLGEWALIFQNFSFNNLDQCAILSDFVVSACKLYDPSIAYKNVETISKLFGIILPVLYELDIVEEEAFLEWFHHSSGLIAFSDAYYIASKHIQTSGLLSKLKETSFPFINWLQTAESEEEE